MDNIENTENVENTENELKNDDKKPVDKNKMAKVLSIIAFLAILFLGTYFITEYANSLNRSTPEEEGTVVLNQNLQELKDDIVVVLKTKEVVDSEKKLSELKVQLNLKGIVTKESLEKSLEGEGYKLGESKGEMLVFIRESDRLLIPNKFYLGEKNGMMAIFETDEQGRAKDIYVDKAPINILPLENQQSLKNFEKYYDTADEAHMKLTAYTS